MDRAEAGRDRIRELPLLALNVFLSQGLSTKAKCVRYTRQETYQFTWVSKSVDLSRPRVFQCGAEVDLASAAAYAGSACPIFSPLPPSLPAAAAVDYLASFPLFLLLLCLSCLFASFPLFLLPLFLSALCRINVSTTEMVPE